MIKKLQLMVMAVAGVLILSSAPAVSVSAQSKCGDTQTQLIACSDKTGIGTISDLIKMSISILTVLIGIVATGGLAYAAILYASAQDDQNKVANAINIIRNIVIGILLYGFTIAIINWLIPGGVIG